MATENTWLTYYSAAVATAVAAWQVFTYVRSGARLRLQVATSRERSASIYDDNRLYVDVDVVNIGKAPTTIQATFVLAYDGWWNFARGKTAHQSVVDDGPFGNETPYELAPGSAFRAAIIQSDDLVRLSNERLLFIGIKHTMKGRIAIKRIRPIS